MPIIEIRHFSANFFRHICQISVFEVLDKNVPNKSDVKYRINVS